MSSFLTSEIHYYQTTKLVPAPGGKLKEILFEKPQTLNPLFPLTTADEDISYLLFASLLKYDGKGNLKKELAENFSLKENGKVFWFRLKDKIFWSDGKEITTSDIKFTVNLLQNPKIENPLAKVWKDVKVKIINEKEIEFILPLPYPLFLENFTLKILPKHVFEKIEPEEILTQIPEDLVFSGPFKIKEIQKNKNQEIEKVILERNPYYCGKKPYLDEIEFICLSEKKEFSEDLLEQNPALAEIDFFEKEKFQKNKNFKIYSLRTPVVFGLFLNQKKEILSKKELKEAIAMSIDREKIIKNVFNGEAQKVESLFLKEYKIPTKELKKYSFSLKDAKKKIKEAKLEGKKITLLLPDKKTLKKISEILKTDLEKIGLNVKIEVKKPETLREKIKEKNYEILLFGESFGILPDPYFFWHSSQIKDGFNLSSYQKKEVDELIEKARKEMNLEKRKEILSKIQKYINEDLPVIFICSPNYLYLLPSKIKGVNEKKFIFSPSQRFSDIENWYLKEKRVKK